MNSQELGEAVAEIRTNVSWIKQELETGKKTFDDHGERIKNLEGFRNRVKGGSILASAFVALIGVFGAAYSMFR